MKIIVLMGGSGNRFRAVGYEKPKAFLRVDGRPMLEHVFDMYSGDHEYILVCNEQLVQDPVVSSLSIQYPSMRVVSVPSHTRGPVHTLSYVWDELDPNEPVLVSYCDFSASWDFSDFLKQVQAAGVDGAIPSYTGFHPHLLHNKKYAGILTNTAGIIERIQEKHSFTEDPQESFHSAGNYYFSRAGDMKRYAKDLVASGETLNGEYYLSMVYYHYLNDHKKILAYPLSHFLQWGTPEDLEEYEAWSRKLQGEHKGITDIPESRANLITIPHKEGSKEYILSRAYWEKYFAH